MTGYYDYDDVSITICNLYHSQSQASDQKSNIQVDTSFIAPEIFNTRKCTPKSDIYAFGIIMYMVANGEVPFANRSLDSDLVRDIRDGLRPIMPDLAPEAYEKLAERCCDADPNNRPENAWIILYNLIEEIDKNGTDADIWDTIYITR